MSSVGVIYILMGILHCLWLLVLLMFPVLILLSISICQEVPRITFTAPGVQHVRAGKSIAIITQYLMSNSHCVSKMEGMQLFDERVREARRLATAELKE